MNQLLNTQVNFVAPGQVELTAAKLPVCQPDQLLIRTLKSLVSPGTERAFLMGMENTTQQYPMGAGYSTIGEIVECGSETTGWQVGERIAVPIRHQRIAAVRPEHCCKVPANLSSEEATFFFVAAVALQGIRKARIELGEGVAVLGAGIIGLLAMQWARLNGAIPALTLDVDGTRLPLARQLGADDALVMEGNFMDRVLQLCGDDKPQIVVDATGHPAAVTAAFDVIRPHGRLVLLGSTRGNTPEVNFYRDVHRTGLTLIGAHDSVRPRIDDSPGYWTHASDHDLALHCMATQRLKVAPLVTHRYAWEDAPAAYEELKLANPNTLGLVLEWDN